MPSGDERQTTTRAQRALDLSIGAAAVGVGTAVVLHKMGKLNSVARQMDRAYKTLSVGSRIAERALTKDNVNIDDLKKLSKSIEKTWKLLGEKDRISKTRFSRNPKSLAGFVMSQSDHMNNARGIGWKNLTAEHVTKEAYKIIGKRNKTQSNGFRQQLRDFAYYVSNTNDVGSINHHMLKQGFSDDMLREAQHIKNWILNKKDALSTANAGKAHGQIIEKALKNVREETLYNIDFLEKSFGTLADEEKRTANRKWRDRSATVGELLADIGNVEDIAGAKFGKKKSREYYSVVNSLKELRSHFKGKDLDRFDNLIVDKDFIRTTNKGEIYSFESSKKLMNDVLNAAANTLPGKIFKLRTIAEDVRMPSMNIIHAGNYNVTLAAKANKEDKSRHYMDHTMIQVMDDFYNVNLDGSIELNKEVSGKMTAISGRYGMDPRVFRQLAGDTKTAETTGNAFFDLIDIFKDRDEYSGSLSGTMLSQITKFGDENWRGNIYERLFNPELEDTLFRQSHRGDDEFLYSQLDKLKNVQKLFKQNTYDLSDEALEGIMSRLTKGSEEYRLFEMTQKQDDELLDDVIRNKSLLLGNLKEIKNHDLRDFLSRIANDNIDSLNTIYLKTDRARVSAPGGSLFGMISPTYNNEAATYGDILRAELQKEAFLRYSEKQGGDYTSIVDLVENLGINADNQKDTDRLAMLTILQDKTKMFLREFDKNTGEEKPMNVFKIESEFHDLLIDGKEKKVTDKFRETFEFLAKEEVSNTESMAVSEDAIFDGAVYDEVMYVNKSIGVKDLIASMNDGIKGFAQKATEFATQLNAGRSDLENVAQSTMYPVFLLTRLSSDMNKAFGMGFSADTTTNLGGMIKGIALMRIMPVGLGMSALDWADDTSQEITGNSLSGYMANGVANVDLASRRALDAIGMTDWLKGEKAINPIMQYWGGHEEFMDYDERAEYYRSGYDPVRKGPWWTFGGVQEARGGEIQYFTPSFARRIKSDWKDQSLYDSYWDKWSHSWLPNPANPLSPLVAALDPYWLEEEHSEDRPYVLSGQMFEEGTPWGAVLNPTIGELLKPQKEMHPWRFKNGVDIKAVLEDMNNSIRNWARDAGAANVISIKNGIATPSDFVSYNAPTPDTKVLSAIYNPDDQTYTGIEGVYGAPSNVVSNAYGQSGSVGDGHGFASLSSDGMGGGTPYGFIAVDGDSRLMMEAMDRAGSDPDSLKAWLRGYRNYPHQGDIVTDEKGNVGVYSTSDHAMTNSELKEAADIDSEDRVRSFLKKYGINIKSIIKKQNEDIKQQAHTAYPATDDEDGFTSPQKLRQFAPSQGMELLNDPDSVAEIMNAGKGADFVREAATSARLIGGIYGYIGAEALGLGVYNEKTMATAQDMTSMSRGFWDMNLGGFGGDIMEISRRFIPEFKRGNKISPLMNTMPDWMPEKFRFGDPYTAVQEGEMRMPGRGYEALNELHPDQFGDYGAFDRFKILADVAPFTPEYKLWKNIAQKTIADPRLKEEMTEITHRVAQMRQKHDFYDYNVVGKSLDYEEVVVSEVMGFGKFRSGDKIYKLAGAKILGNEQESMTDVFNRYIHAGQTVTVATDSNEAYNKNNDAMQTINAAVYIDGENVAESMIEMGDAKRKSGDNSTPATLGRYSSLQKMVGYASEIVAHADLPWLNDQWLRVRSPLESYKAEQIYGTPYQSWEHPIDSFLQPAFERAIDQSIYYKAIFRHIASDTSKMGKWQKNAANWAWGLSDRGAFVGGAIVTLVKPGDGTMTKRTAKVASTTVNALHFLHGGNSYADEMITGAYVGEDIAQLFKKTKGFGRAAGALLGAGMRTFSSKDPWIPDRVQKNWELEDYFDRLTYLKYMGLYHAAAEKALDEEGVDVENFVEQQEDRVDLINGLRKKLKDIRKSVRQSHSGIESDGKDYLIDKIGKKLKLLEDADSVEVEGGQWTHSALIYKQAADATMFALNKNSSWTQMVTALPTNDREYFMEFVKESDPEKRKEILSYASPFMQKALSLAWGQDNFEQEDMQSFMQRHGGLPDEAWAGWLPQVDLKDIEVKTIENEAMNLSDFGFYDSQARSVNVMMAPEIESGGDSTYDVRRNITKVLQGRGLSGVNINVTTANGITGTQIVTDLELFTNIRDMQGRVEDAMDSEYYY